MAKLNNVGDKVDDAINSITKSSFLDNIKTTVKELNENMERLQKQEKLRRLPFTGDPNKVDVHSKGGNADFEDLFDIDDEIDRAARQAAGKEPKSKAKIKPQSGTKDGEQKVNMKNLGLNYYANIPNAYFHPEDEKIRSDRLKGAIGGYFGLAVGTRVLHGGTITRDEYGENNIAGIPFV